MNRKIIIQGPTSQDVLKGSGVKLTCNISRGSLNFAKVSWKKDNKDIELENQNRISVDDSSHELRIQYAELNDSGNILTKTKVPIKMNFNLKSSFFLSFTGN